LAVVDQEIPQATNKEFKALLLYLILSPHLAAVVAVLHLLKVEEQELQEAEVLMEEVVLVQEQRRKDSMAAPEVRTVPRMAEAVAAAVVLEALV
jgi:hypothetical protein